MNDSPPAESAAPSPPDPADAPAPDAGAPSGSSGSLLVLLLGVVGLGTASIYGAGAIPGIAAIVLERRVGARNGRVPILASLGSALGIAAIVLAGVSLYATFRSMRTESAFIGTRPVIDVTTIDGERFDLSANVGRPVVIDVWATWCPPCVRTIPALEQLAASGEATVVGITNESAAHVRGWRGERIVRDPSAGPSYPIVSVSMSELGPPFDQVNALPTMLVLDAQGTVRRVLVGAHSESVLFDVVRSVAEAEPLPDAPDAPPAPTNGTNAR